MTHSKLRLSLFAAVFALLPYGNLMAATRTAATCAQSAVQGEVTAAAAGDTVVVPSGNCTWSAAVNVNKGITVKGADGGAPVITLTGTSGFKFDVSNGTYRLSNFSFKGTIPQYGSAVYFDGISSSFRADHLTFTNIHTTSGSIRAIWIGYVNSTDTRVGPSLKGVIDHVTFTSDAAGGFLMVYGDNDSWNRPDNLSSDDYVFIEDSTIEWTKFFDSQNNVIDGEHGARFVLRNNTFVNAYVNWHDTGSTPNARSTRIYQIYGNNFQCNLTYCSWVGIRFRGGTGVAYDNTIPEAAGFDMGALTHLFRRDQSGGSPWSNFCDGNGRKVCSNFHGYSPSKKKACYWTSEYSDCTDACSSDGDCPPGNNCVLLDGSGPQGYPCRDQLGRGKDDPVTHAQALSPIYWWNNKKPSGQLLNFNVRGIESAFVQANRDFYSQSGTFNGTSGVGVGALSARPATCASGVGYWATDQKKLYVCGSGNTWGVYFTPYAYPHPLAQGATGGSAAPSAPQNLQISQ